MLPELLQGTVLTNARHVMRVPLATRVPAFAHFAPLGHSRVSVHPCARRVPEGTSPVLRPPNAHLAPRGSMPPTVTCSAHRVRKDPIPTGWGPRCARPVPLGTLPPLAPMNAPFARRGMPALEGSPNRCASPGPSPTTKGRANVVCVHRDPFARVISTGNSLALKTITAPQARGSRCTVNRPRRCPPQAPPSALRRFVECIDSIE